MPESQVTMTMPDGRTMIGNLIVKPEIDLEDPAAVEQLALDHESAVIDWLGPVSPTVLTSLQNIS